MFRSKLNIPLQTSRVLVQRIVEDILTVRLLVNVDRSLLQYVSSVFTSIVLKMWNGGSEHILREQNLELSV